MKTEELLKLAEVGGIRVEPAFNGLMVLAEGRPSWDPEFKPHKDLNQAWEIAEKAFPNWVIMLARWDGQYYEAMLERGGQESLEFQVFAPTKEEALCRAILKAVEK